MIVNASGCGAHMQTYGDLVEGTSLPVHDLMAFLADFGLAEAPTNALADGRVAYHDACHALRAQGIKQQPRDVLRRIPGVEIVEIANGDRCCGAAGLYNVLEPEMSGRLMREKAGAVRDTAARVDRHRQPRLHDADRRRASRAGRGCRSRAPGGAPRPSLRPDASMIPAAAGTFAT